MPPKNEAAQSHHELPEGTRTVLEIDAPEGGLTAPRMPRRGLCEIGNRLFQGTIEFFDEQPQHSNNRIKTSPSRKRRWREARTRRTGSRGPAPCVSRIAPRRPPRERLGAARVPGHAIVNGIRATVSPLVWLSSALSRTSSVYEPAANAPGGNVALSRCGLEAPGLRLMRPVAVV